ncbi:hypothetical protein BIV60_01375 [Bacillus sp. MUM 116]|nr:hypothetical protein BIV60_01375 [Bacillus sp. MUM 116]
MIAYFLKFYTTLDFFLEVGSILVFFWGICRGSRIYIKKCHLKREDLFSAREKIQQIYLPSLV